MFELGVGQVHPDQFEIDLIGVLSPREAARGDFVGLDGNILSVNGALRPALAVNGEGYDLRLGGVQVCQFFIWLFFHCQSNICWIVG